MEIIQVALDRLDFAKEDNAIRKDAVKNIGPLAKNIERFGLLVPLLVKANGGDRFEVIDGNRRLEALTSIDADPTRLITCVLGNETEASIGAALSANVMRAAMNPIDEYEVFMQMIAEGVKPKEIAKTFGKKLKEIQQILALANLDEQIKEAIREGKLSWESAQALTLCNDKGRQLQIYEAAGDDPYKIEREIKASAPDLRHALFDKEQYAAKGGTFVVDLFEEEDSKFTEELCADRDLFWELQYEAIEAAVMKLQAEGWAGVANGEKEKTSATWPWRNEVRGKRAKAEHYIFYVVGPTGQFLVWDRVKPTPEAARKAKEKATREKAAQKLAQAEESGEASTTLCPKCEGTGRILVRK